MNVEVRFRGLSRSGELRLYALRRVEFHLGRFSRELLSVRVRIEDRNGPKGGIDKRCQFDLRGPRFGSAIIEEQDSDAFAAVDIAADRAGRTVARLLGRVRAHLYVAPRIFLVAGKS